MDKLEVGLVHRDVKCVTTHLYSMFIRKNRIRCINTIKIAKNKKQKADQRDHRHTMKAFSKRVFLF